MPPALNWELELLSREATQRLVHLIRERGIGTSLRIWPKDQHLNRMRESGPFRYTREVLLHHVEQGDAARFLEMIRSNAFSGQFQLTDEELGLDRLSSAAFQYIGTDTIPWYVSYRVRLGIK
jgi:hypothetical protein